jgi:murein DD-endopeptidase MepM/ murein hydrolase activator NlpD
MIGKRGRRIAAVVVTGSLVAGGLFAGAHAESSLQVAVKAKRDIRARIDALHELRNTRRVTIHKEVKLAQHSLTHLTVQGLSANHERYRHSKEKLLRQIRQLRTRERLLVRALAARVDALRNRRTQITDWIDSLPLQACPVAGPVDIADNFGVMVNIPGVPRHIHQGNDMAAATGTPIVAPFDGTAVASPNSLGGEAVKVYGDAGYVYNAHLSAYGKLGPVEVGDVIGYVGSTGDATSPHDHFEWHPGDGSAVDPHDLLMSVC